MKVAIHSGPLNDGNASRGVGVYTKFLHESLQKLASEQKNFSVDLVTNTTNLSTYDLVHYPYFDFFFHTLPISKKSKTVVTIHDTIPLIYPDHYPKGIKGIAKFLLQKHSLKSVSHIVTDSETSKKDIVRFLGVHSDKVTHIYLGPTVQQRKVSNSEVTDIRTKYALPDEYILYVGDVNWNKNLITLCRAAKQSGISLVIVGKAAAQDNIVDHVENAPLNEILTEFKDDPLIIRLGFVEDILPLYKGALCLCQPSLYEGFGLSILDAMSLGVPTVISKIQVFKELYNDAALFFNPLDVDELVINLKNIKQDSKLRKLLINKGQKHAQNFSWKITAQNTFKVYLNAVTH